MKELTLRLRNPTGFKDTLPRSDTLFGAVCWGIRLLYDTATLERFLATFSDGSPALLLSSAFPCAWHADGVTYLLPKPRTCPSQTDGDEQQHERAKEFRKARYVDDSLFQRIVGQGLTDQELWEQFRTKALQLSPDGVLSGGSNTLPDFREDVIPGNAVDRLSGGTIEGKLFHTTEWFFGPDSGAFILVRVADADWEKKLRAVFGYYGDKGLGGDSSVGKGGYALEGSDGLPFREPTEGRRWLTLSLYYPQPDEWTFYQRNPDHVWYSLSRRKGKIESAFSVTTNIWKKSVLMLEEGSCFPAFDQRQYYGDLARVGQLPDGSSVRQCGFAFAVRMR
jgi:CRISPR-associated protein Csm4